MNVYFMIIHWAVTLCFVPFSICGHTLYFKNGCFCLFVLALFVFKEEEKKKHLMVAVFLFFFLKKKSSFLSHSALLQKGRWMLVGGCYLYFLSIFLALSVPVELGWKFRLLVALKFKMLGINLNKHLSITIIVYLFYMLYVGH